MKLLIPFLALCAVLASPSHAVEPWADIRLAVQDRLALWLDANRVGEARAALRLPDLNESRVDVWHDGSGARRDVSQPRAGAQPVLRRSAGGNVVEFDGVDDFLAGRGLERAGDATLLVVVAPFLNEGEFRAMASFSAEQANDYRSGLNVDLGPGASPMVDLLNVEGAGMTGVRNLLKSRFDFSTWHVFAVTVQGTQMRLRVDGVPQGAGTRRADAMSLARTFIGARHYSNDGTPPAPRGFFNGSIAEVLLYDRALPEADLAKVELYLKAKHGGLVPRKRPAGTKPLKRVEKPAQVQFLAPGFDVRELPLKRPGSATEGLPNINFLRYRHDGVLVAGGYNGKIYLLRDTDGDGVEDTASLYHESSRLRVIMGMAVTPKGDPRGDGVFVATIGSVMFIPDRNGDGKGDAEVIVADGWQPPQALAGGASDCLGLALDREGNVWFGLGTKNMFKAYVPDAAGKATYNTKDERGSIFRVSADFKTREKICSGIRYPVGFAFNGAGDLFVTDQEGATWLPNGNPYDELLHIQPGRHYGFPPRHPQWLPDVNDEPSVFDFEPQHQSTCGFFFNDRADGGPIFGRAWWRGDAFICGESRGKLYRVKLAKTAAGYVAQSQLMASLTMLPIDAALSPRGEVVVTCHSGAPDWGSGPNGIGKLFRVRASQVPQPVIAWAASPTEWRIAFDRPLKAGDLRDLTQRADITAGRHVFAADRYETVRPGYQVINEQLSAPRVDLSVLGGSLSADGRTVTLRTAPHPQAENVAITLPVGPGDTMLVDVQASHHGVAVKWAGADGRAWAGTLPHPDLAVSRAFTQGSAEHEALWPMLAQNGKLTLRGQLDLWRMMRPAIQPGSDPGHAYADETVSVVFRARVPFQINATGRTLASAVKDGAHEALVTIASREREEGRWTGFELVSEGASPDFTVHWFTHEDARPRALPLRRVLAPWALPRGAAPMLAGSKRDLPELRGGDWRRGQALFNGKTACATCHTMDGLGGKLGPDLGNLIHRDYESVERDIRDPNAAINPERIGQTVETTDGESFTAVFTGEKDGVLNFLEVTGPRAVPRARIKSMTAMTLSLMPAGLWDALAPEERRDLMTFLLTPPPGAASPAGIAGRDPHVIRAVIFTGLDGPFHNWRLTSAALKEELERDSRFNVRIITDPAWLAGDELSKTDVLIQHYVNWQTAGLGEAAKLNLLKYVNDGGGLAVMHFANGAFAEWPEYRRQFLQRAWLAGSTHDNYGAFRVTPSKFVHPITAGLAPFDTIDELYCKQVPTADTASEPLITAACKLTGQQEPLAWAFERGKGRVFQSTLGHSDVSMHAAAEFHRRGIAWASGREAVETPFAPAPLMVPGAPAPRARCDVAHILGEALAADMDRDAKPLTIVLCASEKDAAHGAPGAHDYPLWRSRWTRLLGMAPGITVVQADRWPTAEQWQRADVIAFNSHNPAWASQNDAAKITRQGEEMDQFLARGGGIVFIHYALNAGRHAGALAQRLGLAWNIPPARFRHGATDWVLDKAHPLAAGFTDFKIPDESYWRLTGDLAAAQGKVLATSLEENAPTPQMWTREAGAGRVFVSIPGHYTWTYDDPLYRILIFRGLMWTAKQPLDRLAPFSIIGARVEN